MKNPSFLGRTWVAAAVAISVCASSRGARADEAAPLSRDACIDANTKAQELRRDGKLFEARTALNTCANRACPGMVRDDCTRRLDELERTQPTIVFSVKDAAGTDVSAVRVSVDGRKLADRLDGKALAVDPGTHRFSFEWAGQPPVTRQLLVREGEKGRLELIDTTAPVGASASGGASPKGFTSAFEAGTAVPDHGGQSGATQRLWGYGLGGAGIAGLAGGAVFGLVALGASNDSKNECAISNCQNHQAAQNDHDKAATFSTASTVAFIAGGALVALGATLVLSAPHDGHMALRLTPSVGPSVANLALQGAF
jgi:hypothetical protein